MFRHKFFLVLVLLACHSIAAGQHLQIHLSYYPFGTVYLTAIQGTKKDTVGSVVLDSTGRGSVQFAKSLAQPALAEAALAICTRFSWQEDKQAILNALRAAPQRLVKPSAELLKALD